MSEAATTASADDHRWMAQALRLAERGAYTTRPNPMVGCVIVRDGVCVGEGFHQRAGGPHAEVSRCVQRVSWRAVPPRM